MTGTRPPDASIGGFDRHPQFGCLTNRLDQERVDALVDAGSARLLERTSARAPSRDRPGARASRLRPRK